MGVSFFRNFLSPDSSGPINQDELLTFDIIIIQNTIKDNLFTYLNQKKEPDCFRNRLNPKITFGVGRSASLKSHWHLSWCRAPKGVV